MYFHVAMKYRVSITLVTFSPYNYTDILPESLHITILWNITISNNKRTCTSNILYLSDLMDFVEYIYVSIVYRLKDALIFILGDINLFKYI